jgi:hypothetical protein
MKRSRILIYFGIVFLILAILFVGGEFNPAAEAVNYTTSESSIYYHNLSANITGFNNDINFTIDSDTNIQWTNSTGTYSVDKSVVQSWINIYDINTGNLTINATRDNQTGYFVVVIQTFNTTSNSADDLGTFRFIVNATNDLPNFTNINTTYNITSLSPLFLYLNASDEEEHYPLTFNVSFNSTNCTHASWSPYSNNQNCSLFDLGFNLSHPDNVSALMNFTPTTNHVGTYYANISVMDAGARFNSSAYPYQASGYSSNKTTYYSSIVIFNVFSSLSINTTNCDNKIFQENQYGVCNVTVRTKGAVDDLNISSYSILRNYASGQSSVFNTSWFYSNHTNISSNFEYNVTVNVTPTKTEIGNWTINFTVTDTTYNETSTSQIYVYVNRTTNDIPDLDSISDVNVSVNELKVINLTVYDDDLLVPDKNSSFGGFNESINLTRVILNRSNLASMTLSNFSIRILQMPVSGTNRTTAEIRFTLNSSDIGSYIINVSALDNASTLDYGLFNLTVINNSAPIWTIPLNTTIVIMENSNLYFNLSENVSDSDGDIITFSYTNDTIFDNFNLTTAGIINFTGLDADIGQHIVSITLSDGYLTNTTSFNFTILNVNDVPVIQNITGTNSTPSTISNLSSANVTEDTPVQLALYVHDDDTKIPSGQRSFYNESFTVNVTIQGVNTSLLNFVLTNDFPTSNFPNRTEYEAAFTPRKADVGSYNVTINVTDRNNISSYFSFNLTVVSINHNPAISATTNQSSAVNRSFYYNINVTDSEDGNDTSETNTNFTFSYSFLNDGSTVSFLNTSTFNSTTGIINITFNSTQEGKYHINITVSDSSGSINYSDFWVHVYNFPNVSFPSANYVINLTENTTSVLNFTVNHSVGDSLAYYFYVDGINCPYQSSSNCNYTSSLLRYNTSYYGNGTSYNWSFTPNMTDETYNLLKNLTLVVYSNSSDLVNASLLNTTRVFKLNITHTNSNVSFSGHIADLGPTSYDNDITLDISPYFTDLDYSDTYYAQSSAFSLSSNTSSITSSFSSFTLTLGASTAVAGLVSVTASDSSSSASSNSFVVTFVEPSGAPATSSSSGGSSVEVPVSLKIIMPGPVSAYQRDKIEVPLTLYNDGSSTFYSVKLNGSVAKDGVLSSDVNISFSKSEFPTLARGQKENVTMTINVNTEDVGTFEINVVATSNIPKYTDWGKMFLTIKEGENVGEKIVFTEEFIASNPECIELKELIDEAKRLASQGDSALAVQKADEALSACKDAISQAGKSKVKEVVENKLYRYLIISTASAFVLGIAFYSYKRIMLRRKRGPYLQESIKNNRYLEYNRGASSYG